MLIVIFRLPVVHLGIWCLRPSLIVTLQVTCMSSHSQPFQHANFYLEVVSAWLTIAQYSMLVNIVFGSLLQKHFRSKTKVVWRFKHIIFHLAFHQVNGMKPLQKPSSIWMLTGSHLPPQPPLMPEHPANYSPGPVRAACKSWDNTAHSKQSQTSQQAYLHYQVHWAGSFLKREGVRVGVNKHKSVTDKERNRWHLCSPITFKINWWFRLEEYT